MKTKYRIVKYEYHDHTKYRIQRWMVCTWVDDETGFASQEAAREYIFRYCTPPKVTVVETIEV